MVRRILLAVVLLLVPLSVAAGETAGDTLAIYLVPGDPGKDIDPASVNWPADFDRQIQMVNDGEAEFYCEVSTDTTWWRVAKAQRQISANVEWLNDMYDGAEATARMQSVVDLLQSRGLKRLAVRYIPRRDLTCFAKVYAMALPVRIEQTRLVEPSITHIDTALVSVSLMAGLARTAVVDIVPVVAGTMLYDRRFLLQGHFGHSVFTADRTVRVIGETDTYNRVAGARAGLRLVGPLWLVAGVLQEENLIRSPERYGDKRLYRYRAIELGLMPIWQHVSGYVTLTEGYEQYFQESTDDHLDVRFGVLVGQTWGWQ